MPPWGAGNPGIKYSLPGRESNGMIQHLPFQTDECKLQLCYSPPQIEGAKRAGNLNTYQARAWAAARNMERIDLLETGYHGDLKFCPPRGLEVDFKTQRDRVTVSGFLSDRGLC